MKIDQEENSPDFSSGIVATLQTGSITCATKISSDAVAVGFMNTTGDIGIKCKKKNVQIWRRDVKGHWSTSEKDTIAGLPNSIRGIRKEDATAGSRDFMRLHLTGGGGNGPFFSSTWQETEDGGWKEIVTVISKDYQW